jgi:hypothetical protein
VDALSRRRQASLFPPHQPSERTPHISRAPILPPARGTADAFLWRTQGLEGDVRRSV